MNKNIITLNEFSLKIIALIFMILDHIHSYLSYGPEWVGLLPRFVAPLFVYFLVEGFFHTKNFKAYFTRVFTFAFIMLAGNIAINYHFHSVNFLTGKMDLYSLTQGNNIFMTLSAYLIILNLLKMIRKCKTSKKYIYMFLITIISLLSIPFCEGSIYLLPILFIFYFFREKNKSIFLGISTWSFILLAKAIINYLSGSTGISLYSTLCFDNQWAMISVIIPILLYSGKRGNNSKFAKWLFYIAYPLHLWILMILSRIIY